VSQNGVEFESIRTDIHDDYRNRWPSTSRTDVNSVKTGRTDCGRLTRNKSRFICCLRVVLSGLRAIMCTKNWDIAKCVCTLGIKMSGGKERKSLIFMVTGDKTWLIVNRCECKSPNSRAMELLNLRRDGEKRISVLGNYLKNNNNTG
jgi:hypothetical protein